MIEDSWGNYGDGVYPGELIGVDRDAAYKALTSGDSWYGEMDLGSTPFTNWEKDLVPRPDIPQVPQGALTRSNEIPGQGAFPGMSLATIVALANPWRDERGRFAEKGYSASGASITGQPVRHGEMTRDDARRILDDKIVPRIQHDIALGLAYLEEGGARWDYDGPGGIGLMQSIHKVTQAEKISDLEYDSDKDMWAALNGDERRLNRWAQHLADTENMVYKPMDANPESPSLAQYQKDFTAALEGAVADMASNPAMSMAIDRYGQVDITQRNSAGRPGSTTTPTT